MTEAVDSEDDALLPSWRDYLRRFPTVGDALAAARRGEDTLVRSGDSLNYDMQVLPAVDGPGGAIETVYDLSYFDAAETAMINAELDGNPDPHTLTQSVMRWISKALSEPGVDEWLAKAGTRWEKIDRAEIIDGLPNPVEVVLLNTPQEDGSASPTRFGIREVVAVDGSETWDVTNSSAFYAIDMFANTIQFKEAPHSLHEVLIESGARLVTCSNCGEYLTNGIAQWPGIWCALDEEGPICGLGQPPAPHTPKVVE